MVLDENNTRPNLENSIPGCKERRENAILLFHPHINALIQSIVICYPDNGRVWTCPKHITE